MKTHSCLSLVFDLLTQQIPKYAELPYYKNKHAKYSVKLAALPLGVQSTTLC